MKILSIALVAIGVLSQ